MDTIMRIWRRPFAPTFLEMRESGQDVRMLWEAALFLAKLSIRGFFLMLALTAGIGLLAAVLALVSAWTGFLTL